jgi:hypothetical protein
LRNICSIPNSWAPINNKQAREAGVLDDLLAIHGMTEDDIKPKRKKYKDYYEPPKMKDASTQTKRRKHKHKKEDRTKALVKSTLPVQVEPPILLKPEPLPIAYAAPDPVELNTEHKVSPSTTFQLSEPKEPLFAFDARYYAVAGAAAALSAGLAAVVWALPLLKRQQDMEYEGEAASKRTKRSRVHSRDWKQLQ